MKSLKVTISLVLALIISFCLSSCNKDLGIETKINAVGRRTKLSVTVEFSDEEERIFNEITPVVYLYSTDNGKKNEELDSETLEYNDANASDIGKDTTSEVVEFKDLEVNKEYVLEVRVNYEGYDHTLKTENVTMGETGSSAENAIEVATVEDFLNIRYDRDGFFKLTADIDFNNAEVEPMFSTSTNSFKGEIDGDGHTIKNFKVVSNNQYNGLIGYNEGTIKNLNIENMELTTSRSAEIRSGLLVGYHMGKIDKVNITKSKLDVKCTTYSLTYGLYVGGLVGFCSGSKSGIEITNSNVQGDITVNAVLKAKVGGMIGEVEVPKNVRHNQIIEKNVAQTNITLSQEVKGSTTSTAEIYVGGFVGSLGRNLVDCIAQGSIKVTTKKANNAHRDNGFETYKLAVGGVAGYLIANSRAKLDNTLFIGSLDVEATRVYQTYVGGLVGLLSNNTMVENSVSKVESVRLVAISDIDVANTNNNQAPAEDKNNVLEELVNYEVYFGATVDYLEESLKENNIYNLNDFNVDTTDWDTKLVDYVAEGENTHFKKAWAGNKIANIEDAQGISEFILNYYSSLK